MKYIPIFFIIFLIYIGIANTVKSYKIPNEAIRIRVVANSNSKTDQRIKMKVKDTVEKDMYGLLKNAKEINQARTIIRDNVSLVDKDVEKILKENNYNLNYDINYGMNYFPQKKYKGIIYSDGYYESLVVTLGEGKGDNWWCVLFPPLCLMEAEESSDVEYTTLVKKLFDKYS